MRPCYIASVFCCIASVFAYLALHLLTFRIYTSGMQQLVIVFQTGKTYQGSNVQRIFWKPTLLTVLTNNKLAVIAISIVNEACVQYKTTSVKKNEKFKFQLGW